MSAVKVIKRDGREVAFSVEKIVTAIMAAMTETGFNDRKYAVRVAESIREEVSYLDVDAVDIARIHGMVEHDLMNGAYPKAGRAYLKFRRKRDAQRESNSVLAKEILGIVNQTNIEVIDENANKDGRIIPTQRDLLAGVVAKHYAKQYMLPEHVVDAHDKGEIHYHDLDYAPFFPMFNCMLVDLKGMLTNGFKLGNAEIETPKSIATATAVTAQIIAQVASHIYGGTTINEIDKIHAPYVKASWDKHFANGKKWMSQKLARDFADQMTEKECYDAYQGLEYEINTLHTSNGQTPFVTFGFGLGTSWEERLIQKSILKNRISGLGKNKKTAVFPKLVFAIKDGLNLKPEDPNYDIKQIALECASKRMYPDILNYDKLVEVTGSFKTPMGCRSFLGVYEENGEMKHDGRNNLGVISLNLPRIALEAKCDFEKFYEILDQRLAVCKDALMTRIKRLENTPASVAPILYVEGACGVRLKPEDKVADIFKNGRASISLGYIGVNETINALYGDGVPMLSDEVRQADGKAIIAYLRNAVNKWKKETGYGFSLYSTPSESLCYRFLKLDKEQFGTVHGVTNKDYYTNSFHLDVLQDCNPYDKIDFEAGYPPLASGGFISYGEYPNMKNNLKALENVWDYSHTRTPYYGTNTPVDQCYSCGFEGEFEATSRGFECPSCKNRDSAKMSVTRRVCGYLGQPNSRPFNKGKQDEVTKRVKHL